MKLIALELPPGSHVVGVWTPWASVLCWECHGPFDETHRKFPGEFPPGITDLVEPVRGRSVVTHCDSCGKPTICEEAVGHEHNLVRAIVEQKPVTPGGQPMKAAMEQTGGMCSATWISVGDWGNQHLEKGNPYVYATLSEEWVDDGGEALFSVGVYWDEDDLEQYGWFEEEIPFSRIADVAGKMLDNPKAASEHYL